jgi:hypothetical protein
MIIRGTGSLLGRYAILVFVWMLRKMLEVFFFVVAVFCVVGSDLSCYCSLQKKGKKFNLWFRFIYSLLSFFLAFRLA